MTSVQTVTVDFITRYQRGGLKGLERDLTSLSQKAQKVATGPSIAGISRFSQAAGTALLVGIGGALAIGIKASIEFEDAFAGVVKTVQASQPALDSLAVALRDMSTEMPIAATELANIAALGGQLGVPVANLEEFTEVVAKLGVTTNLSTDAAATGLARLANIMGTNFNDFELLGAALVDLGNKFPSTEEEILNFGLRLSGIGVTIGMTEADVLGLATAFTSLGEPAERGATSLQRTFIKIETAVEDGGQALENFAAIAGMTADEFAEMWEEDPLKAFVAFEKGLDAIADSGGNVIGVLNDLGIVEQRAITLLLKGAAGWEVLDRAMGTARESFGEGIALNIEAEKRFGTLASQLQILSNKFFDFRVEVGNKATPVVKDFVQFLGSFLTVLKDALPVLSAWALAIGALGAGRAMAFFIGKIGGMIGSLRQLRTAMAIDVLAGGSMGLFTSGLRALSGVMGLVTIAAGGVLTIMALSRQRADEAAEAVENLNQAWRDFQTGVITSTDLRTAFEQALAQPQSLTDDTITDMKEYEDILNEIGLTNRLVIEGLLRNPATIESKLTSTISGLMAEGQAILDLYDTGLDIQTQLGLFQARGGDLAGGGLFGLEMLSATDAARFETILGNVVDYNFFLEETRDLTARLREEEKQRIKQLVIEQPELFGEFSFAPGPGEALDVPSLPPEGMLVEQEAYDTFLSETLKATEDFTKEFIDKWAQLSSDFTASLQDWGSAFHGYEDVTALSTAEITASLDAFVADQQSRIEAMDLAYGMGIEEGMFFESLPDDIEVLLGAALDAGPETFQAQWDKLWETYLTTGVMSLEGAVIRQPAIDAGVAALWEDRLNQIMIDMTEQGIAAEGSKAWVDTIIANFEELATEFPQLYPTVEKQAADLMGRAQEALKLSGQDLSAEVIGAMSMTERIQLFKDAGFGWAQSIALGFAILPTLLGNVASGAGHTVRKRFAGAIGASSPSKVFAELGQFAAMGFEQGFNTFTRNMVFKNQPVHVNVDSPQPVNGPSITVVNPITKDEDVAGGVRKGMALAGLVRYAEGPR